MVECSTQRERVREIYGVLNGILWQMERSAHYNYIPGTEEDGWDYFEGELSKAEAAVQRSFLGEAGADCEGGALLRQALRDARRLRPLAGD